MPLLPDSVGKKGVFEISVRLLTELLIDCEELRPALEDMGIRRANLA